MGGAISFDCRRLENRVNQLNNEIHNIRGEINSTRGEINNTYQRIWNTYYTMDQQERQIRAIDAQIPQMEANYRAGIQRHLQGGRVRMTINDARPDNRHEYLSADNNYYIEL